MSDITDFNVYQAVKGMFADGLAEAQQSRTKEQREQGVNYTTMFTQADAALEADFALTPPSPYALTSTVPMLERAQKFIIQNKISKIAPVTFGRYKTFEKSLRQAALVMLKADKNVGTLSETDKAVLNDLSKGKYSPSPPLIPQWVYWVGGGFLAFYIFTQGLQAARTIKAITEKR